MFMLPVRSPAVFRRVSISTLHCMRRAKIVCTLGPSTGSYEQIKTLIQSGMNVARLNMSHGEHSVHAESYSNVRRAASELGVGVGIVADLQGPKIRLGRFATPEAVMLEDGAEFTITTEDIVGDVNQCGTTHKGLPNDCNPGDTVLIDDGKVKLEVVAVDGPRVVTPRHRGRTGQQQQGHQPAGRRGERPGPVRQGQGRPALGPADGRGHVLPVVRAQWRRRRRRARDHG